MSSHERPLLGPPCPDRSALRGLVEPPAPGRELDPPPSPPRDGPSALFAAGRRFGSVSAVFVLLLRRDLPPVVHGWVRF